MIKHGWKLLGLIVVIVVLCFWIIPGPIMSLYVSHRIKIPVTVEAVSMWPTETTLYGFRMLNPPGFLTHTALDVSKAKIQYHLEALIDTPATIDIITLSDVQLNIDIRSSSLSDNNWAELGAQIPEHQKAKGMIIHKWIIRNMTVNIHGKGANTLGVNGTKHFETIELNEVGNQEGFPTKELITQIFKQAELMQYVESSLNPVNDIKSALNPLREL